MVPKMARAMVQVPEMAPEMGLVTVQVIPPKMVLVTVPEMAPVTVQVIPPKMVQVMELETAPEMVQVMGRARQRRPRRHPWHRRLLRHLSRHRLLL